MKKLFVAGLSVLFLLAFMPACKKKKTDSCSSEATLAATTLAATTDRERRRSGPGNQRQSAWNASLPGQRPVEQAGRQIPDADVAGGGCRHRLSLAVRREA